MTPVTSAGHKLGQLIGDYFEDFFSARLTELAEELGNYYCDRKGPRPRVRGNKKKLTWEDENGNSHDLDYVFEKNGSYTKKGEPAAFVELAWRRYTKHSKNKAGEIEAALLPLRRTYKTTCNFTGVILAGEFTDGALKQLESNGIRVLYIPYVKLVSAFLTKGIDLNYPENATNGLKQDLVEKWEALSPKDLNEIDEVFGESIKDEYDEFSGYLRGSLLRKVEKVLISPLFGHTESFNSPKDAILAIKGFDIDNPSEEVEFSKFEIYIQFNNGDNIQGSFHEKFEAITFLENYE